MHRSKSLRWAIVQDIEKNLMKQDAERDERRAKNNQPAVVAQGLEMNDASGVRRRGKMMLPAPQVTIRFDHCMNHLPCYFACATYDKRACQSLHLS